MLLQLVFSASLALAATRAVAPVAPVSPVAPAFPLAALAPVLSQALAAPLALPAGMSRAPGSLDPAKARVLLERAGPLAAPAAGALAAAATPAKTLEAVNSVLWDVNPERLAAMSSEELNAVSSLLFDAIDGRAPRADPVAVGVLAKASAERLAPLVGKPAVETSIFKPGDERHEEKIDVRGLPQGARWITSDASMVFRHYTTEEDAPAIVKAKTLLNGFVSYVQRSGGLWHKSFVDATGLFLTKPGVSGDQVGVPAKEYARYVDLLLPAGLPILELEPGRIFLLPLPPRTRGWIADLYRKWASGGGVSRMYRDAVESLDRAGGPGPELAVPIEIVAEGRAR